MKRREKHNQRSKVQRRLQSEARHCRNTGEAVKASRVYCGEKNADDSDFDDGGDNCCWF